MRSLNYTGTIALFILFCLSLATNWDQELVLILVAVVTLMMVANLGQSIALREIFALYMCVICLLMPYLGYLFYGRNNAMAILWVRYMPIDADRYFSFCFPAVTGYILTLSLPYESKSLPDKGKALLQTMRQIRETLAGKQRIGIILMIVGILVTFVISFLPVSLQFFFNLFYFSSFAGFLYIYFSAPFPFRKIILIGFVAIIIFSALRQGMFTIVVYMGMTIFPLLLIGLQMRLWRKLLIFFACVFMVALLQSVKPMYRMAIWEKKYQGNRLELFADLVGDKLSSPASVFDKSNFFFIYYRMNQGFNVALVMKHMPAHRDFDEGRNLFISIASAFVPRFLWQDKPEAGGKANMKYYTGVTLRGWATNVGPLGEAYGSFGHAGGILYMMLLGLFIRFFYGRVLALATSIPLLLCWIPVLFYQVSYSAENDTLQILNSLIKTSVFIYLVYKLVPKVLKPGSHTGSLRMPALKTPTPDLTINYSH